MRSSLYEAPIKIPVPNAKVCVRAWCPWRWGTGKSLASKTMKPIDAESEL